MPKKLTITSETLVLFSTNQKPDQVSNDDPKLQTGDLKTPKGVLR